MNWKRFEAAHSEEEIPRLLVTLVRVRLVGYAYVGLTHAALFFARVYGKVA